MRPIQRKEKGFQRNLHHFCVVSHWDSDDSFLVCHHGLPVCVESGFDFFHLAKLDLSNTLTRLASRRRSRCCATRLRQSEPMTPQRRDRALHMHRGITGRTACCARCGHEARQGSRAGSGGDLNDGDLIVADLGHGPCGRCRGHCRALGFT